MIPDNDLLLFHYRDGLEHAERERIAVALRTEPALQARLQRLLDQLNAAAAVPDIEVPAQVQGRWASALAGAAGESPARRTRMHTQSPRWRIAAAACVLVFIAIGVRLGNLPETGRESAPVATVGEPTRLEHGLRWQLASTERQLTQVNTMRGDERARLVAAIIAQNQLYAAAAQRAGDERLARALRSFTPILENIATQPAGSTADDEVAQLGFELRVMQARLAAAAASPSPARPLDL